MEMWNWIPTYDLIKSVPTVLKTYMGKSKPHDPFQKKHVRELS